MKKISIDKLIKIYDKLIDKDSISASLKIDKFNYLNLSILFSRDEREFDVHNYKLLKNLNLEKKDRLLKTNKNKNLISGYEKYFKLFKEKKYLLSRKLPLILFLDIIKLIIQLIDITFITLVIIFMQFINLFTSNKKGINLKNKKIYSIYYWKRKSSKSGIYYYPEINNSLENKAFISSFADTKYFSHGLIHSLLNSKFVSPARTLNFKDLILSILQFFHLFFYDIYLLTFKKNYSFLKLLVGWKRGSEIFYSIIIYNSLISLAKNSQGCEFISWHENQITNRAFSLAISYVKRNNLSDCTLSSFNGSLFTQQTKRQFLPLKSEFEIGFWGEKYFVQDKGSFNEMQSYLKKENLNIKLKIAPSSMQRINTLNTEKFITKQIKREITIVTHASYWDLIGCILAIFNKKNKKYLFIKDLVLKRKKLFIRLHPSLNKNDALKEIKKIKEIPNYINIEFIDNSKESLFFTLKSSKYCFFGVSTYVNFAIEIGIKVISVQTSHINKSPIKLELLNASNLLVLSPW